MGHRFITALIFLNVIGLVACVMLIAAAITKDDPGLAGQIAQGVSLPLRMFVAGAGLAAVAWGILAFEFDRTHAKKKLLESAAIYALLIISLILFFVAGWRLPRAIINSLPLDIAPF